MHIEPYQSGELKFAYCCQVYYRWQTYCRKPNPCLSQITATQIEAERPSIHILNLEANETELALVASLLPTDSIGIGASKIKGGTSKILKQMASADSMSKRLGAGYFACTIGPRTSDQLNQYLGDQCQHHGYENRSCPPTYVRTWSAADEDDDQLQANHSHSVVQWHLVFSTWNRKGTFSAEAAEAVVDVWQQVTNRKRVHFRKVSFLPDHVHLAIRTHPTVIPADVVVELLNSSQELMFESFEHLVIPTGNRRIWKPSAYVGTYGELSSRQIQAYLRKWGAENETKVKNVPGLWQTA